MQKSFIDQEIENRLDQQSTLTKLARLIEWSLIRVLLKGLYKREVNNKGGEKPYDSLMMFKAVLLGQWHSLSDPQLEHALRVRLDFIAFCGAPFERVPDASTLCRFRNRLIDSNKLKPLLNEINRQLQKEDLMVSQTNGAVLDATIIQSAARPKKSILVQVDEKGDSITYEDGSQPGVMKENQSADADASWLKKGKKSYYGYRSYLVTDEHGYVRGVHIAPANESEMNHFKPAIEEAGITKENTKRVLSDKGSSSKAHRQWLKEKKLKSGIMHKASRGHPLTTRQKRANLLISKKRYIVEQCFGTMKRLFRFSRASYMGTVKVNAQMLLKSMCVNLLKAANKIEISCSPGRVVPSM